MTTYIQRQARGRFVSFEEPLSPEDYGNLGESLEDYRRGMWVELSDEQVAFHMEHPRASVDEVWNLKLREDGKTEADAED